MERLQTERDDLDKKLKYIRTCRIVSAMIFAGMLIGYIVAAPPIVAVLGAISLGSMANWIDSVLRKEQKELLNSMNAGTRYIPLNDFNSIRISIDSLEGEIDAFLANTTFPLNEEAVKIGVAEIKRRLRRFMTNIEKLGCKLIVVPEEG